MKNNIYFDNAASAIINPKAVKAAVEYLSITANPSSLHSAGLAAGKIISDSRAVIAKSLNCTAEEIIFTSSGTEANNTAIFSAAKKGKIITAKTEHPSVAAPMKYLENNGSEVVYIPIKNGLPDYEVFEKALDKNVYLVSFMLANNQTGALLDLKEIYSIILRKNPNVHFHCDAVQGYLKSNQNIAKYCHTASISAHKIGGLKGTGALFIKKGVNVKPFIMGGEQEKGIRAGTENLAGIAAFGAAAGDWLENPQYNKKIKELRTLFIEKSAVLEDEIEFYIPENHIDSIINLSFRRLRSEVALNALSASGIYISSSSACSPKSKTNIVLQACGLGQNYINGAVRIGFSPFNTQQEIEILIEEMRSIIKYGK